MLKRDTQSDRRHVYSLRFRCRSMWSTGGVSSDASAAKVSGWRTGKVLPAGESLEAPFAPEGRVSRRSCSAPRRRLGLRLGANLAPRVIMPIGIPRSDCERRCSGVPRIGKSCQNRKIWEGRCYRRARLRLRGRRGAEVGSPSGNGSRRWRHLRFCKRSRNSGWERVIMC